MAEKKMLSDIGALQIYEEVLFHRYVRFVCGCGMVRPFSLDVVRVWAHQIQHST